MATSDCKVSVSVWSDKDWYHGELTREEAEQELKASGCDCYLVRQKQGVLVLSLINGRNLTHFRVHEQDGYKLKGSRTFRALDDLLGYCRHKFKLGQPCPKHQNG
jgi:hypothetical protein